MLILIPFTLHLPDSLHINR